MMSVPEQSRVHYVQADEVPSSHEAIARKDSVSFLPDSSLVNEAAEINFQNDYKIDTAKYQWSRYYKYLGHGSKSVYWECIRCQKSIAVASNGYSNAHRHYEIIHKMDTEALLLKPWPTSKPKSETLTKQKARQDLFDRGILKIIAKHGADCDLMEWPCFKEMIQNLDNNIEVKSNEWYIMRLEDEVEQKGFNSANHVIPEAKMEATEKPLQPDAENVEFCLMEHKIILPCNVLAEIAKFLDFKTLQTARMVNTEWKKAMAEEFRKQTIINAELDVFKSPDAFISVSSSDTNDNKLISQSIWIPSPIYLEKEWMRNWLKKYGRQLLRIKIGRPIMTVGHQRVMEKNVFIAQLICLLINWSPNLKVLEILFPYSKRNYNCDISFNIGEVSLECLTIGCNETRDWTPPKLRGTSELLVTVLRCIESLKTLKIVNIASASFDGFITPIEGYDHGNKVLANITELDIISCSVHPMHLFGPVSQTKYKQLKKLRLSNIDFTTEDQIEMDYIGHFLLSVRFQLQELTFKEIDYSIVNVIPTMPKLEVFKIILRGKWGRDGLELLNRLPELKTLCITSLDSKVKQLFIKNKNMKKGIRHESLKEFKFRCASNDGSVFDGIGACFPKLLKLDINFHGTDLRPVVSQLEKYKNIKELKLVVYEDLCTTPFDRDWVEACSLVKLCLEFCHFRYASLALSLSSTVHNCIKCHQLQELELKGMKIFKEEYEWVTKNMSTSKLKLRYSFCDFISMESTF